MDYVLLIIGFFLLAKGADLFVEGSVGIAKIFKIPTLIIGLTFVAFGTSAPELAVSFTAALKGNNAIALSNVVGSNIVNLLFIVGVSAIIKPLVAEQSIIKRDYPISLIAAIILLIFAYNGLRISKADGLILLLIFVVFMVLIIVSSIKSKVKLDDSFKASSKPKIIISTVVGLVFIIAGGDMVVESATSIARLLGLSETLIGLTIVAIGTSLPELVTSVAAAIKGESDIAIGNVVGSNIFNILFVIGISSIVSPISLAYESVADILILIVVTSAFFVPILLRKKVSRLTGLLMIISYVLYSFYICFR